MPKRNLPARYNICPVALWYFMPNNGQPHWHTEVPVLDSVVSVMIVAAFGVAVAIIISGVAGMM